jgi:cystathionine beta-lyase
VTPFEINPNMRDQCLASLGAVIDLTVPPLADLRRRRSEKWAVPGADVLSATIAEMDFPLAQPVAEALRAAIARHDLGYAPSEPRELREAFAGFAERRLAWSVDPEQVVLVPDVMAGVVEAARVLADSLAFATPAYPPFFDEPGFGGLGIRQLPLGDEGALEAELARGTRVLLLSNPHNPTGRALRRDELARIAELCAAEGAWVIADEIHAPLTLPGATFQPFLEVSDAARECGISLTSASKAFNLAGLKAAVLVTASERTRAAMRRLPPLADRAGLLGVVASEAAFRDGDEWLDALLARLDANRTLLAERLAASLPEVVWTPPEATYLAWLDCRALGLGDDPAAAFLARGQVALSPGLHYGAAGAGFVRLNFGTSPELVGEMVTRMGRA